MFVGIFQPWIHGHWELPVYIKSYNELFYSLVAVPRCLTITQSHSSQQPTTQEIKENMDIYLSPW